MLSFVKFSKYFDKKGRNGCFQFVLCVPQILHQLSELVRLVPFDLGQLGRDVKICRQVSGQRVRDFKFVSKLWLRIISDLRHVKFFLSFFKMHLQLVLDLLYQTVGRIKLTVQSRFRLWILFFVYSLPSYELRESQNNWLNIGQKPGRSGCRWPLLGLLFGVSIQVERLDLNNPWLSVLLAATQVHGVLALSVQSYQGDESWGFEAFLVCKDALHNVEKLFKLFEEDVELVQSVQRLAVHIHCVLLLVNRVLVDPHQVSLKIGNRLNWLLKSVDKLKIEGEVLYSIKSVLKSFDV